MGRSMYGTESSGWAPQSVAVLLQLGVAVLIRGQLPQTIQLSEKYFPANQLSSQVRVVSLPAVMQKAILLLQDRAVALLLLIHINSL